MQISRRVFGAGVASGVASLAAPVVFGQSQKVKIGVLTDMSGPTSAVLGVGSVDGARMAIEDFGKTVAGMQIEMIYADHQNKPDIGSSTARRWFDEEGVDMPLDLGNSAVAIACQQLPKTRTR